MMGMNPDGSPKERKECCVNSHPLPDPTIIALLRVPRDNRADGLGEVPFPRRNPHPLTSLLKGSL